MIRLNRVHVFIEVHPVFCCRCNVVQNNHNKNHNSVTFSQSNAIVGDVFEFWGFQNAIWCSGRRFQTVCLFCFAFSPSIHPSIFDCAYLDQPKSWKRPVWVHGQNETDLSKTVLPSTTTSTAVSCGQPGCTAQTPQVVHRVRRTNPAASCRLKASLARGLVADRLLVREGWWVGTAHERRKVVNTYGDIYFSHTSAHLGLAGALSVVKRVVAACLPSCRSFPFHLANSTVCLAVGYPTLGLARAGTLFFLGHFALARDTSVAV